MQQDYFGLYLIRVRKLTDSSVKHYFEALKKISLILLETGILESGSIYDIDTVSELDFIKHSLLKNPEFVALDERGNRMYSAGLNRYIEFAEGKAFLMHPESLALIDHPCSVHQPNTIKEHQMQRRDRIIIKQVFESVNYTCEINSSHQTFISQNFQKPYVEGHHVIPISLQENFSYSLDIHANIIALCPTCHRFLHYGLENEKKKKILKVYDNRKERLQDSRIKIGCFEFLELLESRKTAY